MKKFSLSEKIYFGLILTLAILAAINVFLPYPQLIAGATMPAPKLVLAIANVAMILILYGGLGFTGLVLSKKIGLPEIWDKKVSNREKFLIPLIVGVGLGIFLIVADMVFANFNTIGRFVHPPFPNSIIASGAAGIGEEVIFRLFFIPFWVWLISFVILKKRFFNQFFWLISIASALAFSLGHTASIMILYNFTSFGQIPLVVFGEMILLNGTISLFAAYYFRRFGFLAPVGIHFWTDIVWHVIWGLF